MNLSEYKSGNMFSIILIKKYNIFKLTMLVRRQKDALFRRKRKSVNEV